MRIHVLEPLKKVTWKSCSGPGVKAVLGMRIHVLEPLQEVTWRSCSGPGVKAVHGTRIRDAALDNVNLQRKFDDSDSCVQ